ncbi:MAG: TetR/AcrR family transcriptional regulator [Gammaproteobacteria bacterium]
MPEKSHRKLTQDERSAISDQRLIDAAIQLIVVMGTAGTTLKALGEESGYSRGHVTYRFGTKAGLFKSVIKQVSQRWARTLETRVEGLTGAAALLACSDAYFEFVRESPNDIRAMNILSQQACEPDSELKEITCRVKQTQAGQLRRWLLQGQADGSVNPDLDTDACAAHFIAFNSGITYLWMLDAQSFDWPRVQGHARQQLMYELRVD